MNLHSLVKKLLAGLGLALALLVFALLSSGVLINGIVVQATPDTASKTSHR